MRTGDEVSVVTKVTEEKDPGLKGPIPSLKKLR